MGAEISLASSGVCGGDEVKESGDLPKSAEENKTLAQKMTDKMILWGLVPFPRPNEEESIVYGSTVLGGSCSVLLPESKLKQKLFNWPDSEFSEENCVFSRFGTEPYKQMEAGDAGIDFNLPKAESASSRQRLSDLLKKGKPVMLCAVATTCPVCMAYSRLMESFARDYPQIICVAITIMQPHPEKPERCFENGRIWEESYSKGVGQPKNLEERLQVAQVIQKELPSWLVLADDLTFDQDHVKINPFWSTYGPAPRCAYLLDDSGLIVHSQLWWGNERSRKAADAYLAATHQNGSTS